MKSGRKKDFEMPLNDADIQDLVRRFPDLRVMYEIRKATDWIRSKGRRFKDYPAFMRNWLRKEQERQEPRQRFKEAPDRNRTYVEGGHI